MTFIASLIHICVLQYQKVNDKLESLVTFPIWFYLKNNTFKAMNTHPIATKGLSLSPIRLIFQQNPEIPGRFISGCPGSCTIPASNIVGRISLRYAHVQIRRSKTVKSDPKSNNAQIGRAHV